jgi:alpha-L-fucosidase
VESLRRRINIDCRRLLWGEARKGLAVQAIRFPLYQQGQNGLCSMLAWPEKQARIRAMGKKSNNLQQISNVELLGHEGNLTWHQEADALVIDVPENKPGDYAYTFKVVV